MQHHTSQWHANLVVVPPDSRPAATLAAREVATTALAVFWTAETA